MTRLKGLLFKARHISGRRANSRGGFLSCSIHYHRTKLKVAKGKSSANTASWCHVVLIDLPLLVGHRAVGRLEFRIVMVSPRWRPLVYAAVAILLIWGLAVAGFRMAKHARVTAEKVAAYVADTDLVQLKGEARARALARLAEMINALPVEERRKIRLERSVWSWFEEMTEQEKTSFVDATMPSGFRQMLTSFETMPEEQRKRVVDDALRRLRRARAEFETGRGREPDTNAPILSPELESRIRTIGLQSFYGQSSAQTKAELAPVLEEMQRSMESGRPFRGPGRFHQ